MVGSRTDLEGASVADLFAGSGAMGIEALSRGAAAARFVDTGAEATRAIEANLKTTGLSGDVVRADVVRHLREQSVRFDVAFADPPYAWDGWGELFEVLAADLLVTESNRPIEPAEGWRVLKVSRYGDTVVTLAENAGAC